VSTLLFLKIILVPILIAGVTLSVRRWGAGLGGWIGGFPWVAGPISLFMALEQGPGFVSATIPAALMGSAGTILFAYCYAGLAVRLSWLPTVLISYGVYFVVALLALNNTPSLPIAVALNILVLTVTLYFFPRPKNIPALLKQPRYDIPLRMLVATAFVVGLTQAAEVLGPGWSGLLTPFPIMTSTLAVFTHTQQGSDATARILYGIMLAGYGFTFFLIGVFYVVPMLPVGWAYALLTVGTMLLNGLTLRLIR
jgi:hypothetical protein